MFCNTHLKTDVVEGQMAEISVNVTNCTNYNDFVIPVKITVTNKEPQKDFHFAETTINKTYILFMKTLL